MPSAPIYGGAVTTTPAPRTITRAINKAWERREAALADPSVGGREYCQRLAAATDAWIVALAERARAEHPRAPRFALVAVGGYGRGELSPQSDIDLVLIHQSKQNLEQVASAIWYPIWDAGLKLGHALRTVDEHLALARDDLDTATALLTGRLVAGYEKLGGEVVEAGRANFAKRKKKWMAELGRRVRARQENAGEVAYILEPDLKDGHGGIRDCQSLWWAEFGGLQLSEDDDRALNECYDVLLSARVALHRATKQKGDILRLEDQDAAAAAAGAKDADAFMGEIAAAARTVAWVTDENWGRVGKTTGMDGRAYEQHVAPREC